MRNKDLPALGTSNCYNWVWCGLRHYFPQLGYGMAHIRKKSACGLRNVLVREERYCYLAGHLRSECEIQGSLNVLFRQIWVFSQDFIDAITGCRKTFNCGNRNTSASENGGIAVHETRPLYLSLLRFITNVQLFNRAQSFRGNSLHNYGWHDKLPTQYLLRYSSVGFFPYYLAVQHPQANNSPLCFTQMTKSFAHSAEMLERNRVLVSQNIENPKRNNVFKGIHATERNAPVFLCEAWPIKSDAIPIAKLGFCNPGKPYGVIFTKRSNHLCHSHVYFPRFLRGLPSPLTDLMAPPVMTSNARKNSLSDSPTPSFRAVSMNRANCSLSSGFFFRFATKFSPAKSLFVNESFGKSTACLSRPAIVSRRARYRLRHWQHDYYTGNRTRPNSGSNGSVRNADKRPSFRA